MFCQPQLFEDVLQTQHVLYHGILELRGRVCVTVLLYGASYHWTDSPLLLYGFKLVKTLGVVLPPLRMATMPLLLSSDMGWRASWLAVALNSIPPCLFIHCWRRGSRGEDQTSINTEIASSVHGSSDAGGKANQVGGAG